jgi:polysaccharide deacetylase family protein (PEP-CTERM system associated)
VVSPVLNALTIDFEDWYQGLEIPPDGWTGSEDRIERSGRCLLEVLAEAGKRATFFVLGPVAERHPALVREIRAAGHEVGTHGYSHSLIYRLSPDAFRDELQRSIRLLEDVTGEAVLGHRAPFFSITRASLWALDVLAECGIRYDSSIFPVVNYRYGIPDAPRWPYQVCCGEKGLMEFPVSTYGFWGRNLLVAGGAYFRIYPYALTRWAFRSINWQGQPAVFYLHPWELDPEHPRIPLPRRPCGRRIHWPMLENWRWTIGSDSRLPLSRLPKQSRSCSRNPERPHRPVPRLLSRPLLER